jgi:hypothetical protein
VLAYRTTCDSDFGHPYFIMTFIEGKSVYDIWNEPFTSSQEGMHLKILESIATSISELRKLSFPAEGSLHYVSEDDEEPPVSPAYYCRDPDEITNTDFKTLAHFIPILTDSRTVFNIKFEDWFSKLPEPISDVEHYRQNAAYLLFNMIIKNVPVRTRKVSSCTSQKSYSY